MTLVQSVTGPVDSSELGLCLPHEHLINDVRSWWAPSHQPGIDPEEFAARPVSTDILWELRQDPFSNLDNCQMNDVGVAIEEIQRFQSLGGVTVVDATSVSIGRNLSLLAEISVATGVTVIAGTGFYLDSSQPEEIKAKGVDEIVEILLADLADGDAGVKPGFIGEIGVSSDFTPAERRSLEAASIVQTQTGLPLQVHLPGWFRLGHDVLDVVESRGVDPRAVVLCHMGPSGSDQPYQQSLAARGAFIQYDMMGMELFYADQGVQCPSDEDNARYIMELVDAGYAEHILMSQDIFLKTLLRRYGGPGFGHIVQYFVPRLRRHGATDGLIETLMVANPRSLFEQTKEIHDD
jgi:phosphotriesterase-related protein